MYGAYKTQSPHSVFIGFGDSENRILASMMSAVSHTDRGEVSISNLVERFMPTWSEVEKEEMTFQEGFKKLFDALHEFSLKNRNLCPVPVNMVMFTPIGNQLDYAVAGTIALYAIRAGTKVVPIAPMTSDGGIGHPFYTPNVQRFLMQPGDLIVVGNEILFNHIMPPQIPGLMKEVFNTTDMANKLIEMTGDEEKENASCIVFYNG